MSYCPILHYAVYPLTDFASSTTAVNKKFNKKFPSYFFFCKKNGKIVIIVHLLTSYNIAKKVNIDLYTFTSKYVQDKKKYELWRFVEPTQPI